MQTTLLIFGSDLASREEAAIKIAKEHSSHFDTIVHKTTEDSGIEAVRATLGRLAQKPFSSGQTTAIFIEAQLLGLEAQNTLLKSLEEPGETTQIILTCPNPYALIPTVVSRCQKIDLGRVGLEISRAEREKLESLFNLSFGAKLAFAEEVDIEKWEVFWREKLLSNLASRSLSTIASYLRSIAKTREFLLKKANVKLAKINLILDTPKVE